MNDVLARFLREDAVPSVRDDLKRIIQAMASKPMVEEYTTNRFNLVLDGENQLVKIDDDLDSEVSGDCLVAMDLFLEAIKG